MDIGLQEIFLIGVIALIVLGPERLPGTIRTIALWISRIKRNVKSIQSSIEKEINAEELRQRIHNENVLHQLGESKEVLDRSLRDIKHSIESNVESGDDQQIERNDSDHDSTYRP